MKRNSAILIVREYDLFSARLAESGFEIINLPMIQTAPVEDLSELDEKLKALEKYDGLFFTSPKAAEVFLARKPKNDFGGKIYALGKRTKLLFENTGFETIFRAEANTAEELINSFDQNEFAGKKFLFLRGDKSLRTIPELLRNVAQIVDEAVVYRTVENQIDEISADKIREKLSGGEIGWICFFSPSGIESFIKKLGDVSPAAATIKIAAIGETTAKKAAEKNLKVGFISLQASAEDFALGLINHIKNIEQQQQ